MVIALICNHDMSYNKLKDISKDCIRLLEENTNLNVKQVVLKNTLQIEQKKKELLKLITSKFLKDKKMFTKVKGFPNYSSASVRNLRLISCPKHTNFTQSPESFMKVSEEAQCKHSNGCSSCYQSLCQSSQKDELLLTVRKYDSAEMLKIRRWQARQKKRRENKKDVTEGPQDIKQIHVHTVKNSVSTYRQSSSSELNPSLLGSTIGSDSIDSTGQLTKSSKMRKILFVLPEVYDQLCDFYKDIEDDIISGNYKTQNYMSDNSDEIGYHGGPDYGSDCSGYNSNYDYSE